MNRTPLLLSLVIISTLQSARRSSANTPLPSADSATSDPAAATAGRKLLKAALRAKGGDALARVKDLVLTGKGTMTMQGKTLPITLTRFLIPGKSSREEMSFGPTTVVQVLSGDTAFMKQDGRIEDLPPPMIATMRQSLWRDPNFILLHADQPGAKLRALQAVTRAGRKFEVLQVIAPDGDKIRLYLDAKTFFLSSLTYEENHNELTDELTDYQLQGGIAFPRKAVRIGQDAARMEILYQKVEINRGIAPALFAK